MKRVQAILFGVALVLATTASAELNQLTNYRLGNTLVTVGDSIQKVRSKLGGPSRIVELQNKFGVKIGERWEYDKYRGGPIHFFVIGDGSTIGNIYR